MSFNLKFVAENFETKEEFLGFLHCKSGLSGKAFSETLFRAISVLKLDINDCGRQGYDGVATISVGKDGMTAHMINKDPKAIYTHCFSQHL